MPPASQSSYLNMGYYVPNYRPHLSHFCGIVEKKVGLLWKSLQKCSAYEMGLLNKAQLLNNKCKRFIELMV